MAATRAAGPPSPLASRDFRWLGAGAGVSMLGDQFTLLALPWLALRTSDDPRVLGAVLALTGAPPSVLILLGGALADRHPPQRVLLRSRQLCGALLALLVALLLARGVAGLGVPLLLALSLALGVASAFGIPAASAVLPRVLPPDQLQPANGLLMALRQVAMAVGPLLAGALVALGGGGAAGAGAPAMPVPGGQPGLPDVAGAPAADAGLIAAFAVDALSFWLAAALLSRVAVRPLPGAGGAAGAGPRGLLVAVGHGLRQLGADRTLRRFMAYLVAGAVLAQGPAQVALPLLAAARPGWGAGGYGALLGAHGLGALLGTLAAVRACAAAGGSGVAGLGRRILLTDAAIGVLVMLLPLSTALWPALVVMAAVGLLGGGVQVRVFSWVQQRVPPALMGRAMGAFMAVFMGLVPLSAALTSGLMRWAGPTQVLVGAGAALLLLVALAAWLRPLSDLASAAPTPDGPWAPPPSAPAADATTAAPGASARRC